LLTEVKAYSTQQGAPQLLLDSNGSPETDWFQIRNIEGLNPVKAAVNTTPFGSVDGESYVGSSVLSRNVVLTIHPNPDWANWTYETLRRLLYRYFTPKLPVKLEFYSDDMAPVQISGVVEDIALNPFSQDPEYLVSVICPDPYFTAINGLVVTGQSVRPAGAVTTIDYQGGIECGITLKVTRNADPAPTTIGVRVGADVLDYFNVIASVSATKFFSLSSVPLQKSVWNVDTTTGVITSLLSKLISEGSRWPMLQPGSNAFSVITDQGVQDWQLIYFERYGGL
jgi:Phage tail protein RIFT-related domain